MAAPKTTKISKKKAATDTIKIQYYRSAIGFNVQQKLTVKGLGFGKLNSTRDLIDTPALRGMIAKVPHLAGNLTAQGTAFFQVSNGFDIIGGGTIGSDATVNFNAGGDVTITPGGSMGFNEFSAGVINNGGMINGNTKIGFDSRKRVVVTYHKFDSSGLTQIVTRRRDRVSLQRETRLVPPDVDRRLVEIFQIERSREQENTGDGSAHRH